uniref:Putative secreted protein n=1 Tax=Anopheles darlingi TaxID=43151 RepID=A0A2M4D808_ANODA
MLHVLLVTRRWIRVGAIEQCIVVELLRFQVLRHTCHHRQPSHGKFIQGCRIDVGVGRFGQILPHSINQLTQQYVR